MSDQPDYTPNDDNNTDDPIFLPQQPTSLEGDEVNVESYSTVAENLHAAEGMQEDPAKPLTPAATPYNDGAQNVDDGSGSADNAQNGSEPTADEDPNIDTVSQAINSSLLVGNLKSGEEALNLQLQQLTNAETQYGDFEFIAVERQDLKEMSEVFVAPEGFDQFIHSLDQSGRADTPIVIIHGPRNSGRYTLALAVALNRTRNQHMGTEASSHLIREYIPDATTTTRSLVEIVTKVVRRKAEDSNAITEVPEGAVVIIRDFFEDVGLRPSDLSPSSIAKLRRLLDTRRIRLILTTATSPNPDQEQFLKQFIEQFLWFSTINKNQETKVNLSDVYTRHLDQAFPDAGYNAIARAVLTEGQAYLIAKFKRPSDVKSFFRRASVQEPQTIDEALKIADDVMGRYDRRTQTSGWFNDLSPNEQLYAMFVVLFKGLKRANLDEEYDQIVFHLRRELADRLDDPRNLSKEELFRRLRLRERREVLEFDSQNPAEYEEEVHRQIENYFRLLWSLISPMVARIKALDSNTPHHNRLRRQLATVIAQIGRHSSHRLQDTLNDLARHPSGYVVLTTADILRHLAQDVEQHPFILEVLKGWVESDEFDLRWAATNVIASVYQTTQHLQTTTGKRSVQASSILTDQEIAEDTQKHLYTLLERLAAPGHTINTKRYTEEIKANAQRAEQFIVNELKQHIDEANIPAIAEMVKQEIRKRVDDETRTILTGLKDQLTFSLVRALNEISLSAPNDVVRLLKSWLQQMEGSAQDNQHLACIAANHLFGSTIHTDVRIVDEQRITLLDMLPEMLHASSSNALSYFKELIETVIGGQTMAQSSFAGNRHVILALARKPPIISALEAIDTWYGYITEGIESEETYGQSNPWNQNIYPALLRLVNLSTQSTRRILTNALIETLLVSEHTEVQRGAMALLTRIHVLDGVVLDLPLNRTGLVAVETFPVTEGNEDYISAAFKIIQRLATLTPLRVYHLGWAREAHDVGNFSYDDPDSGTLHPNALSTYMARPRLLMPLLRPAYPNEDTGGQLTVIDPSHIHFVLTLNRQPISDWQDLLDDAYTAYRIEIKGDDDTQREKIRQILNNHSQTQQASQTPQAAISDWRWGGKFFLNQAPPEQDEYFAKLPEGAITLYQAEKDTFSDVTLYKLEGALRQQIIRNLHALSTAQWFDELARYRQPHGAFANEPSGLYPLLEQWLEELDIVLETIPPRDITLLISRTVLLLIRGDGTVPIDPTATALLCGWLESGDPAKTLMARACTKQVFNYYSVINGAAPPTDITGYDPLLSLLEPFMRLKPDHSEFGSIFSTLFEWARDPQWAERLITPPPGKDIAELMAAAAHITVPEDIGWVMDRVEYYEALMRITNLFIDLRYPLKKFITLTNDLLKWLDYMRSMESQKAASAAQPQARRTGRGAPRPTQKALKQALKPVLPPREITEAKARALLDLPGLQEENRNRIIRQIQRTEQRLLSDKSYRDLMDSAEKAMKSLLDQLRFTLFSKDGIIPALEGGKCYALFLVDVSFDHRVNTSLAADISKTVIDALTTLNTWPESSPDQGNLKRAMESVVPMVHRLGRREVVEAYPNLQRRPNQIKLKQGRLYPRNLPRYTPLVGPILSRYVPDEVAFVVVVSAHPQVAHDLEDWQDMQEWGARLFVLAYDRAASQRVRQPFDQSDTTKSMKKILLTTARR